MSVTQATEYAQVDRTLPYKWEQADPNFATTWTEARSVRVQQMIDTATDIALAGDRGMLKFLITRDDQKTHTQEIDLVGQIEIITTEGDHDHDFIEAKDSNP